ncbi:hypothetical protein TSUD_177100 [Trifolium subterraneum]|uniref:Uncharacterized protein n=1 Tax=Trifolium subterraneum TaxID=3900 RepID=A0A2Z6PE75_TRISU|nr:hypothetical protein TSUD_177100 [Trifolium subterraneum]
MDLREAKGSCQSRANSYQSKGRSSGDLGDYGQAFKAPINQGHAFQNSSVDAVQVNHFKTLLTRGKSPRGPANQEQIPTNQRADHPEILVITVKPSRHRSTRGMLFKIQVLMQFSQPRPAKIARVDQGNSSATGQVIPTSPKFVLPPAIGSPDLVKKSPVSLSDAEQAIMNDMGPEALKNELADAMVATFKLMEISSFINGRECKYLEERDAAREEAVLANQRLEQAKVNHAAYKEKYTLQAGLVTKLAEKEMEAARLVGEKAELEGRVKDLTTEKETLEGKVRDLESRPCSSGTAPDADELVVNPNGDYKGFTRAALVSRIFELEGKELDVAKSSFDNAVAQLMVLNPGVELIVEGASELKEVQDGAIVSPSPDEED